MFDLVNRQGFASIELPAHVIDDLGLPLYEAMDRATFHPNKKSYYNEIAFYWPNEWSDVEDGIGAFHEPDTLDYILPVESARAEMNEKVGNVLCESVMAFASSTKKFVIDNHHGLRNNELRLSRVMVRQMNESHSTTHAGSDFHEDRGYEGRAYRQLLSAIVTTHGIPTESPKYSPKIGELLVFNSLDRRRLLNLDDEFAFVHKGPKSGPKMFFFFEFLGPNDRAIDSAST